jgi:hypothetical protein
MAGQSKHPDFKFISRDIPRQFADDHLKGSDLRKLLSKYIPNQYWARLRDRPEMVMPVKLTSSHQSS